MIGAATRGLLRPYNKSLTLSLFPFCLAPLSKLLEHERLHSVMCSFQVCMYDKSKRTSISYLWLHVTKLVCVTCENNWVTTKQLQWPLPRTCGGGQGSRGTTKHLL